MKYESMTPANNRALTKAVDTLNNYGMQIFENHCDHHQISYCDRNRCIAKCKFLYNRDDLMEIPIPDNLKQERWNHYTRICMYPTKKARQLIAAVDESHKNQFIPKFDKHDFEIGA